MRKNKIGTKKQEHREFCLLEIINTEGKGQVKGKVLGNGEQLRKNLYMDKIRLLSHNEGQICTLPLKHIRSCVSNQPMVASNIPLMEDEQSGLKARRQTIPFETAKRPCHMDFCNQGYLYSMDFKTKIGKFTKSEDYIMYTYFDKPYTVRLVMNDFY